MKTKVAENYTSRVVRGWCRLVLLPLLVILLQKPCALADQGLRIGFSRSIIGEVNENDAMAVIKLWARQLVVTENLSVDPFTKVYADTKEMETSLREKNVELISLTSPEFFRLQNLLDPDKLIMPVKGGSIFREYVLIVQKESPIKNFSDLKGSTLQFWTHPDCVLSIPWLDIQLSKAGQQDARHTFKRLIPKNTISSAVLPVFFKQADACLVTQKGFETMAELNPQISRQLRILGTSGKYVPNLLGFRNDYKAQIKDLILERVKEWGSTVSNRQVLTIFHTDSLSTQTIEVLLPTLELIKEHQRFFENGMPSSSSQPAMASDHLE